MFEHCVALVASGRVDVERLVTHRLRGLDALVEALQITRDKASSGAINPAQLMLG